MRERERKALGQADKHDGNPQHISGNINNNSNKEQPHRQAVHVMHHLEARIRCSTSSPSTSAAASGAASSFTCLTLSHFFALLEVVAGCSECCAFFLEFGAMTRHKIIPAQAPSWHKPQPGEGAVEAQLCKSFIASRQMCQPCLAWLALAISVGKWPH